MCVYGCIYIYICSLFYSYKDSAYYSSMVGDPSEMGSLDVSIFHGNATIQIAWSRNTSFPKDIEWTRALVKLPSNGVFSFMFTGIVGGPKSDIAIDDVRIDRCDTMRKYDTIMIACQRDDNASICS